MSSANDNNATAAELPQHSEEENASGDTEQGRIVLRSSSTTTTWLEHEDEEDVAPVPSVEQIADLIDDYVLFLHQYQAPKKKIPANDNNATTAELPHHSEEESSSSDIEQGIIIPENTNGIRSSSSSVAAAISFGTSAVTPLTTTAWPLVGLEHVDVDDAAPVPLIQQIADMGIEKDDTNTKINSIFASCDEDISMMHAPRQDAMEEIEDGDDAAPRPFNSAEFEDEPKPKTKIELCNESSDEDDGPPLSLTFSEERDSLSDAKKLAATPKTSSSSSRNDAPDAASSNSIGGNVTVGGDVQQTEEHQSPGDEESIQRRVVRPGNNPVSNNVRAREVVSTAEREPSVTILQAYLVEESEGSDDDDDPHDTVYEATPLEPELPWWKQRRTKVFMMINCVLMALLIAVSVGLRVSFSRPSVDSTATIVENTAPAGSLFPTKSPTKSPYKCFGDRKELDDAVKRYVAYGCGKAGEANSNICLGDSQMYGWPMGSWCVGDVTDMSSLFEGLDVFKFNEDISGWNVGNVTNMNRMFFGATSFSGNVSSWDVSSVTDMREMFKGASSFNENLCAWRDSFPYSNVPDIFADSGCTLKDDPLSAFQGPFCASYCNTVSPTACFSTRHELKVAVDQYVQGYWSAINSSKYGWPIGSWCVGNVTDMKWLFQRLDTFNEDISGWDVGQVTDMSFMFYQASSFNPDNLLNWDTSSVTTMESMFERASAFNGNISSWNTSAVTDMSAMFFKASSFNQNLCAWKDKFPYSKSNYIFDNSGCTFKDDPSSVTQGPFCASGCSK
jgi:surface protein